jgi:hypothetical protein
MIVPIISTVTLAVVFALIYKNRFALKNTDTTEDIFEYWP